MISETQGHIWQILGYTSNILFGLSLIFQWWVSERQKRSVVPQGFWWMRNVAAAIQLVYGAGISQGPVILTSVTGLFTYTRNIVLIRRERRGAPAAPAGD